MRSNLLGDRKRVRRMIKVTLWGTRGFLATPGPETTRYGENTACVELGGSEGTMLILDAGTGIRRLGASLPCSLRRVDILLTHLHLNYTQGLGFFAPLHNPEVEVHIWGPASTTMNLRTRLMHYLSPPLFPVRLRDLSCKLFLHEVPLWRFCSWRVLYLFVACMSSRADGRLPDCDFPRSACLSAGP